MAVDTTCRYEDDFILWSQQQAKLLREAAGRGINFPLDWENLAEEVESLGRTQRQELRNRIRTIIEHLLKLEHSSAREPREGWRETVERSRQDAELLLDDNPSLRREVPELSETMFRKFAEFTLDGLIRRGEIDKNGREAILARPYDAQQVLGSWLPDSPQER